MVVVQKQKRTRQCLVSKLELYGKTKAGYGCLNDGAKGVAFEISCVKSSRETLLLNRGVFLVSSLLPLTDMKLNKVYTPGEYEADIYALWEKTESFVPKNRGNDAHYSIVMPPPNANANLHIGTAMTIALEDIAARYHRMTGKATLLLPGADHAGFETQVVYEKHLAKEGKSRFDFSKEELYSQIWDFVAQNRSNFETQFRRVGASCDWSRYTYTLDDKIVKRAYKTFKKLWDDKLIYRGERLVNFCTFHGTAFADIEVEYQTEMGKMYYMHFPLVPVAGVTDEKDHILVATTRPETMLGDVAVAVHPDDKRFKQLVGRTVKIPLADREVPVIADKMVDPEFGTGAVKITAAHDPNDFDVAKNHNLPLLSVITEDGKIGHDAPRVYHGLTVEDGRKKVIEDVDKLGLLEKIEDHEHRVGHCYKCKNVLQPMVRDQWFVDMEPLAKKAIAVLEKKEITFYPDSKRTQLITYLKGLRDWNISRQIAWGIPIPAFQNVDEPDDWIFDERVDQEVIEVTGKTYHRDPDVFDTWFSSSSWPYATLDFPDSEDFKKFFPLSLMETGGEILNPWVSRMIMLGLYITGDVPFKAVYIHGYVMAEDGTKMSKSIGNVIDPMPVIDEYGSDALRMGIIAGRAPAVNRGYDRAKVEGGRNFANKLWNVARFIEGILPENFTFDGPKPKTPADHWMLSKLQHSTEVITTHLEAYRFSEAFDESYRLVWDDLADWYVEASKGQQNVSVLAYALDTVLRLVHPFAPFVTETIWQTLPWTGDSILATNAWPKHTKSDGKQAEVFEEIISIVGEIRAITTALKVRDVTLYHKGDSFISTNADLIKRMTRLAAITEVEDGQGVHLTQSSRTCWLGIDLQTSQRYATELTAKQAELTQQVTRLEGRLGNKSYVDNAPKQLVEETKQQLKDIQQQIEIIKTEINRYA